jgi:UDP-N-acetylglucosamine 2-epimerase (non-hydrolysing)
MGVASLVGTDAVSLVDAVRRLLTDQTSYAKMASGGSPYGDGYAAQRITEAFGLVKGSACAS